MSGANGKWTGPAAYFAEHLVFTHREFVAAHTARGRSRLTSNAILARYLATGRLVRVRRGLYAAVPVGREHTGFAPDAYLIAAKAYDDGVLAYHTALAFHGVAYSVWYRFQTLTSGRARRFTFGGAEFVSIQAPRVIRALPDFGGGVARVVRAGAEVHVTTIERTLVDLMHAPQHGGGWEEIWRSLEGVAFVDPRAVAEYALGMRSALTAARVGYFLEQHKEQWMLDETHLEPLLRAKPKQPLHWDRRRESGTWVARWGLVIPKAILERRWEEPQ
jgi:predicted transcriptional regulator of viral defense system